MKFRTLINLHSIIRHKIFKKCNIQYVTAVAYM